MGKSVPKDIRGKTFFIHGQGAAKKRPAAPKNEDRTPKGSALWTPAPPRRAAGFHPAPGPTRTAPEGSALWTPAGAHASLPRLRAGRGILVLCCQLLLCRYARHKDSGHIGILLRNFKGWFLFFGLLQTAHCKDRRKINGRTTPSIFRRTLPLFPAHSPTYSGSATSAHAIHYEDEKQIYPPTAYWQLVFLLIYLFFLHSFQNPSFSLLCA